MSDTTNLSIRIDRGLKDKAERIWNNAERNGTANMSMDEIDAEIKAARTERKTKQEG